MVKLEPEGLDSVPVVDVLLKTCISLGLVRTLSAEELGFQVAVVSLVVFSRRSGLVAFAASIANESRLLADGEVFWKIFLGEYFILSGREILCFGRTVFGERKNVTLSRISREYQVRGIP